MIAKYIFIKKEDRRNADNKIADEKVHSLDLNNPVSIMVKDLFKHIKDEIFVVNIDGEEFRFLYKCTKTVRKGYYITIEVEYTPAKNAGILHEIHSKLTQGVHRKDFNIILSFDGASEYYCEKLFPVFGVFERKMRNLIYNILIQTLGTKWIEAIPVEIEKELLDRGAQKSEMIENCLQELTFSQLETLLFDQYHEISFSQLIDKELSIEKINEMNKEEIIKVLEKARPASIWERYFVGTVEIADLEKQLPILRKHRNAVAHHKYFSIINFNECKTILNPLIKDLDLAIKTTEKNMFGKLDIENLPDISNLFAAFTNTINKFQELSESTGIEITELVKAANSIKYLPPQLNIAGIVKSLSIFKDKL